MREGHKNTLISSMTPQQAFENYLLKVFGISLSSSYPLAEQGNRAFLNNKLSRTEKIVKLFTGFRFQLLNLNSISLPFIFEKSDVCYLFDSEFAHTQTAISKLFKESSPMNNRYSFELLIDNKIWNIKKCKWNSRKSMILKVE
ncbi:MAG TPA: hypothetical protein VI278_02615 [Nitrososphaeraceae archaeon]